jgi:predicted CXXCH cytochrome family protein
MGGVGPAAADNGPHVKGGIGQTVTPDGCAGCHRLHSGGQDGNLLLAVQPNLCYTCHGTTGTGAATDVQNGVGYVGNNTGNSSPVRTATVAGALRGGGFEKAMIDSANPTGQRFVIPAVTKMVPALTAPVPVTSSHSVNTADVNTIWGNGAIGSGAGTATDGAATPNLTCGSCHDPHGNGNYRILKPMPEGGIATLGINNTGVANAFSASGTYTGVIADAAGTDAASRAATHVYTTGNFWAQGDANAPAYIANVAEWCSTCHTRYLATRDSSGATTNPAQRSRADSGDPIFKYRHTSSNAARNCITCHVSHGSNAATGAQSGALANPDGSAAPGDQNTGDSRLLRIDNRGECLMCHDK